MTAVRISTELDLHRCITKMPHTKRECIERTRLYFLVYICDHQCALIHGRPPMMREFQSLKSPKVFLQSSLSTPDDLQLISLVELWSVSSRVFDLFGADVEVSLNFSRFLLPLSDISRVFGFLVYLDNDDSGESPITCYCSADSDILGFD